MPPEIPERDPVKSSRRRARVKRRFPENACCGCGETRLNALIADSDPIICIGCNNKSKGKSTKEKHHLAGKANHAGTIEVSANFHSDLSAAQYDWPEETLRNPKGSPLLAAAACIRGVVDWIVLAIKEFLLWVADMLERLDHYLHEKLGPDWWRDTPIASFAAKRSPDA
jgi:hypothetical protein